MTTTERFDAKTFLKGLFESECRLVERSEAEVITIDPTAITPETLPAPWRELYEERAAIREFDGQQAREHAEAEALKEIMQIMESDGVQP
jgi:hypothetical protein